MAGPISQGVHLPFTGLENTFNPSLAGTAKTGATTNETRRRKPDRQVAAHRRAAAKGAKFLLIRSPPWNSSTGPVDSLGRWVSERLQLSFEQGTSPQTGDVGLQAGDRPK